jgi:hypothetical protein
MKTKRNIDFIDQKLLVNNLRTKANMLSSNLPAQLHKTFTPTTSDQVQFYRFEQIG